MKIGNIKIDTPVFLAPMAGYTDYPFRVLCKRSGAGVVYSEFVSADGIIRENIRTLEMIQFKEEDINSILALLKYDKKNSHGKVNFVLLEAIGKPIIDIEVGEENISAAFDFYKAD